MSSTPNVKWIDGRKEALKNIESFQTGSRVQVATQLVYMHNTLYESVAGWAQWLNKWLMDSLTHSIKVTSAKEDVISDKELEEIFFRYRDFVREYIEFDIEATEMVTKQMRRKMKKKAAIESPPPSGMIV